MKMLVATCLILTAFATTSVNAQPAPSDKGQIPTPPASMAKLFLQLTRHSSTIFDWKMKVAANATERTMAEGLLDINRAMSHDVDYLCNLIEMYNLVTDDQNKAKARDVLVGRLNVYSKNAQRDMEYVLENKKNPSFNSCCQLLVDDIVAFQEAIGELEKLLGSEPGKCNPVSAGATP